MLVCISAFDRKHLEVLLFNRAFTVVWTAIDSIAENFVFFFLKPIAIKSKTSAYMEHLIQNVVDFALIRKW